MTETSTILKKVAFIDDNPATNQVHLMLAKAMKLAKEVETYETAEEACRKYGNPNYQGELPNVFFVDINLPQMTGHELSLKLRGIKGFDPSKNAICFLTASKDIRDVVEADNNEFDHYFWKPLDKRKVSQLLRDAFGMDV